MLPQNTLSRRQFITSVSALALSAVMASTFEPRSDRTDGEFVLINGWMLKRSELV
jgi:hypothetical protein